MICASCNKEKKDYQVKYYINSLIKPSCGACYRSFRYFTDNIYREKCKQRTKNIRQQTKGICPNCNIIKTQLIYNIENINGKVCQPCYLKFNFKKDKQFEKRFKEGRAKHYFNNREKYSLYKKNKRKIINFYKLKRYKTDILYRLNVLVRNRVYIAIKSNQKTGSAIRDLGCTILELKKHLESKFQEGMAWDNWNFNGWHIDHIRPLSSFNLENREEFLKACHFTNLQPLWAEENLKKNNKWSEENL